MKVVIADDEPLARERLRSLLAEQAGVEVVAEAESGTQVIELLREVEIDLLLLDITMPVLDGMSALSEIRRTEAASGSAPVPAIAVTANAMPHQVADYIMGGFDTHLAKPFKRKELLHALRTLLRA